MKKLYILYTFVLALALAGASFGQTIANPPPTGTPPSNQSTFSLQSQAIAMPGGKQTIAATEVGATFAITKNLSLRNDNILAPGDDLQGYYGGVQYFLPIAKLLNKTSLNASNYQAYVTGSAGVDIVSPTNAPTQQHYSFLAGGGVNYGVNGTFSVNLFEVRFARMPGGPGSTAIVSSGIKLSF